MKGITVKINAPEYLAQWLAHTHGRPARFPKKTPMSYMLTANVSRPPKGYTAHKEQGNVEIVIPDNAYKKPENYHYLTAPSKRRILDGIGDLFDLHLWNACAPYVSTRRLLQSVAEFCQRMGIDAQHHDTIARRFRRIRARYARQGVVIGRRYHRKEHTQP